MKNKQDIEALYGIAEIERRKGKMSASLARLNSLLEVYPENIEALMMRVRINRKQQHYQKALDDLLVAERVDAENPDVHATLNSVYKLMGNKARSEKAANRHAEILKSKKRKNKDEVK